MKLNLNSKSFSPETVQDIEGALLAMGRVYRYYTPLISLAAPNYYGVIFKTPPTGAVIYQPALYAKTGDEIYNNLLENPTVSGGAIFDFINLNRNSANASPCINQFSGTSVSGLTITGGLAVGVSFVPGISQGNVFSALSQQSVGDVALKRDTVYALKSMPQGALTKYLITITIGYIDPNF